MPCLAAIVEWSVGWWEVGGFVRLFGIAVQADWSTLHGRSSAAMIEDVH
jgi:hypothetical protein